MIFPFSSQVNVYILKSYQARKVKKNTPLNHSSVCCLRVETTFDTTLHKGDDKRNEKTHIQQTVDDVFYKIFIVKFR